MLEENTLVLFFKKHASKFAFSLLFLCLGIFFLEKQMTKSRYSEKQDYLVAQKVLTEVQTGQTLSDQSIDEITKIVERRPTLAPKYDQLIGLALLSQQQEEKALTHMAAALQKYEPRDDKIARFNEITFLIEKKEYAEAEKALKELNLALEAQEGYPTLYACNLVRTFFLAQKNHDLLLAKVTWDKLQAHPTWPQLAFLFQENSLSMEDYLKQVF